jgi:hypothetical protein
MTTVAIGMRKVGPKNEKLEGIGEKVRERTLSYWILQHK